MNNKKNSGCFRPFYCPVCSFSKENIEYKIFSRSLSPEISGLRRSLKVNLFSGLVLYFFPKSEGWFFIGLFFIGPYCVYVVEVFDTECSRPDKKAMKKK